MFSPFFFSDGMMLRGSDMLTAGVYHRQMLVDQFTEHGEIPQWNPYAFGGMPFVDAFHGDIFYPLSVLKFFVPLFFHLSFNLILHIFLAGLFMFLAARQFKLGKTASLFSAASYMFAHYLVSLIAPGHEGKIYVTALFPLVILFLDKGFQKNHFLNFSLLGLILGIIIVSPHAQMAYFTLWGVALYSLFKLVLLIRKTKSAKKFVSHASLVAYAVILALLLSAIQFYPGYVYTTEYSPRTESKSGWDWATSWSMHEEEAFSLLIPEFSGANTESDGTYYWGKNPTKEHVESTGIVPLFFAIIGIFFSRRKEAWFFGAFALFALIYALGATTPIFKIFYYLIPKVDSLRAPSMIMFWFSFAVALASGMGIQSIIDWKKLGAQRNRKQLNNILLGIPAVLFLLALIFNYAGESMLSVWTTLFFKDAPDIMTMNNMSKFDLAIKNIPAVQSGAWFSFLFTALSSGIVWLYLSSRTAGILIAVLILFPIANGLRFDSRFVAVINPQDYFGKLKFTEYFEKQPDKFRVQNMTTAIGQSRLPQSGIEVVTGYHGNELRWYYDLLGGSQTANWSNPRVINLIGARYILLPTGMEYPGGDLGDKPVETVQSFAYFKTIRNDNAFARSYLASEYRLFENLQEIYSQVANGVDDLSRVVYLEEEPELTVSGDSLGNDSCWIEHYSNDSVLIGLNCTVNRLLVLTDNYYDSWHVFVDGTPAKLLRSYGCFRAVAVPAGAKEVFFKYKSDRYARGRLITWVTSLYLLIVFGFFFVRSKFMRKEEAVEEQSEESTEES